VRPTKERSEELRGTNTAAIIAYIIWSYRSKNTGKGVVMMLIMRNFTTGKNCYKNYLIFYP